MREKINKARKNKKGFSLVELIVVIAIMAVLVAILAPQFLKYVERSRVSADKQNVTEIINAVQAYASDDTTTTFPTGTVTLNIKGTASTADANVASALTAAGLNIGNINLKSQNWGTDKKITIVFGQDTTTKALTVTVTPTDAAQ